jgi:DNA repair protein RadC
MPKIKEMPAGERPRERLWTQGASGLRTAELLAILLRTGMAGRSAVQVADELLVHFQSLDRLARAEVQEIARIKGVGRTKAVQIKAAFELAARWAKDRTEALPMRSPWDIEAYLGEELRQLERESLRVLVLDTRLRLKQAREISRGTVNETTAHPRDVLEPVIAERGYGFVLVHNHPSGDPSPSHADLLFTQRVRDAAQLLQVQFHDHVILGKPTADRPGFYSFREAGYL